MQAALDPSVLAAVKKLHQSGRYLDAWRMVEELPPPEVWSDLPARLNAATLIGRLGDSKRASKIVFQAWRDPKNHVEAREDMFWEIFSKRGAFLSWQWLMQHVPAPDEPVEKQADHEARMAVVLMRLRDFERCEQALDKGMALQPGERFFALLRSDCLKEQDRREEALDVVLEVVNAEPDYVAAIDSAADLLVETGNDDEAVELLQRSLQLVQAGALAQSLTRLLMEMKRHEEAVEALDRYESLMPLMDQECRDWVAGVRCDIASINRDLPAALNWARQVKESGFYKTLATKLEADLKGEWRRVHLPVPYVQQHNVTCSPAALTSIANFWGVEDVEHLELADEICHDGTPDHRERQWAQKTGWAVREFRVTVEAAQALIDAGMPFVLNTTYPGGAHAQVVAGYDDRRTVFFIRDPGSRHTNEFLASETLEQQAPFGPRGLVLVPMEHAERLAAQPLPDAEVYDLLHQIQSSLAAHEYETAMQALERLRVEHSDHTLRWRGELAVATYDVDAPGQLAAFNELLKRHPSVEDWQNSKLRLIDAVRGREAMLAELSTLCAQQDCHPLHWLMLAQYLRHDDRRLPETRRLLKRVLRQRIDAEAIICEAGLLWRGMHYEEATELYRLASCLECHNEDHAMAYFKAARWVLKSEDALDHLRRRFEAMGGHSSEPGSTLYQALAMVNHPEEALDVLEQSLSLRTEDADHAVYVAGELVKWNKLERAQEILAGVTTSSRAASWHRVQARLAERCGDWVAQMKHLRAILDDSPQDTHAHRAIASLIDNQEGKQHGLRFLQEACARHPFDWHLHLAWLDWAHEACDLTEAESVVRELLRIDPHDAWAHRELADVLRAQKRYQEAHAVLDESGSIDRQDVSQLAVRGHVLEDEGRKDDARELYSQAVCLEVDKSFVLRGLVRLSRDQQERKQALGIIQEQLQTQVTQGDAVLEFCELSRAVMDEEEMEKCLRELREQRPDLWQTATCLAEHLRQTGRTDEAVAITGEATSRFPMLPRVWMEHARNVEASQQRKHAVTAAMKIRELNPSWAAGMRFLSELLRKEGRYQEAREVLEETLRQNPQDSMTHGWLGEVLWDLGEKDAAIRQVSRAAELSPGYDWAWSALERWSKASGRVDAIKQAVDQLQSTRPGEARTWMIAVRRCIDPNDLPARLAALDKAISLAPDSSGPVDLKAQVLGEAGRFEEALDFCRKHPSGAVNLRFREGWLLRHMGANEEAVRVLQEAVAIDPRHAWPWKLLANWHEEDGRLEEAEKACRMLVRVQPDDSDSLGYLGNLLTVQKKRTEAKKVFLDAWQQAPHDEFCFQRLFWLRVEDREWEEVSAQLNAATNFFTSLHLQSRWFVLHCRQEKWNEAADIFERVLANPGNDENAFVRLAEELRRLPENARKTQWRRYQRMLLATLRSTVLPNQRCGKLYVQLCALLDQLPDIRVLEAIPEGSDARQMAFHECIDWIGQRWKKRRTSRLAVLNGHGRRERLCLQGILSRHRDWIRKEPDLYGIVSYALHMGARSQDTIDWLSDWRERGTQIAPYVLNNLVLALQETGEEKKASEVAWHGMTLAQHNGTKMRFHLWCGIERLLLDDASGASSLTAPVVPGSLDGYGQMLHDFYCLLLEYQSGPPPSFSKSRPRLEKFAAGHPRNPVMLEACRKTCSIIGQKIGSSTPRWWWFARPLLRLVGNLS